MSPQKTKTQEWALASYELQDSYTDFILSRQAMLCSPGTLRFYHYTAGKFVVWLEENGISSPQDITARHIRSYLAELASRNLSDSYINGHARAIRTFVRFLYAEKYIPEIIGFKMPTIAKKRLLVHSADEVKQLVESCNSVRCIL